MDFHALHISEKIQETPDTVTLTFDVPESLKPTYHFKAGQYLTLRLTIDGKELRRSYSMSSAPLDGRLSVTVKKVSNGRASTWLHDVAQVGTQIEVAPPEGRFTPSIQPDKKRTWYLIAAGSGITPMMSIAKTVLEEEAMSTVYLLYGSRTEPDIIFKAELDRLAQRYEHQFFVDYILSKPIKDQNSLFGLFKKSSWNGLKGRIDDDILSTWLDDRLPVSNEIDCQYYTCGPGNMAEVVEDVLIGRGVQKKQIHKELFINAGDAPGAHAGTQGQGLPVQVIIKGETHRVFVSPENTILDMLVSEKIDAPYSCTSGACSTCMAKVKQGKVTMDACYALDDDEVANGYILTCQAHPQTPDVIISFDE